jgi:holliday junction DNA helicase RuvA
MIGKLYGLVDEIDADHVILNVQGVGYVAFCSSRTLMGLKQGEAASLLIETYVREDMIRLFGFATHSEREWFRLLQSVQGVGAKVALAVLSTLTSAELANAIALQDKAVIARTPGVGPKVALRLVTELKGKVPALSGGSSAVQQLAGEIDAGAANSATLDAISALSNLGYSRDIAAQAVAAALKNAGEGVSSASLIRLGLKELAR